MTDSDDHDDLLLRLRELTTEEILVWMDKNSRDLLDFAHNPDAEQTLHQLGFAAQELSDQNKVPEGRKQELLERIKICLSAFEKKEFGKFTQQLFEFGRLFDRYILEAHRSIASQEKRNKERAPFLFYVVNRAVVLWGKDSNHDLSLPHLSSLLDIELGKIFEAISILLEGDPEFLENNQNLKYIGC